MQCIIFYYMFYNIICNKLLFNRLTLQNLKRDIDETIQKHDQNYEEILENRYAFLYLSINKYINI